MSNKRGELGSRGEQLAVEYLIDRGYTILHRNYRRKFGEIDIIARHQKTLVFAEVKTRSSTLFDTPAAAVTLKKQQQISRVAEDYLARNNLHDRAARFDVLSVILRGEEAVIDHITNAFDLA